MKTLDEIKQDVRDNMKWEFPKHPNAGGQHVGITSKTVTLVSEDLSIRLEIGYCRSQIQNRDTAKLLFELLLDEFIK